MTTLISFLGKGKADSKTGYRIAHYCFDKEFARTVPFFGMGLLDYVKPDKLILAGTMGSMWDVFFDHQQTDDEATLTLVDAVEKEAVTQEMLTIHEQCLTEKLGIPVQCLLISYARDEAEQTAILTSLADSLQPGEQVILDVTHGFRHLPMLALVAARYLTHVRKVKVDDVYYGALEMTSGKTKENPLGETPVLRLGAMLKMLNWVEALAVYEGSGNYGVFADLLKEDGMDDSRAGMLAQGAYFERSSNPVQAKQSLSSALDHVREHQGALGNLFRDTLAENIGWFRRGSRADWELALADRYLERKDYLRATNYLYESLLTHAVDKYGGNPKEYKDRDAAFAQIPQSKDAWLLKNLRNNMVHGVQGTHKDTRSLLQDEEKLNKKLRALRKSLFR